MTTIGLKKGQLSARHRAKFIRDYQLDGYTYTQAAQIWRERAEKIEGAVDEVAAMLDADGVRLDDLTEGEIADIARDFVDVQRAYGGG